MAGDQRRLHAVGAEDPIWRLWTQLPEPWKRPVIGDGIEDWEKISENGERRIDLTGLPDPIPAELAWMSHWQGLDGTRSSVLGTNQLANILRRAIRENHPVPASIRAMDWETAGALQRWFYATRWGRLPWLSTAPADPRDVLADPGQAVGQAAAFRRWVADPANRLTRRAEQRFAQRPVHPRLVNDDLRAVAELFAFVAANPAEARQVLGPHPWSRITDAHAAGWFRQVSRIPHRRELNDQHYVDDHALAQIPPALPLLGLGRDEQMLITLATGSRSLPAASTTRRPCA
jgi:hypothetical protein